MSDEHFFRALRRFGQAAGLKRRGVAGEDRVGRADAVELRENPVFYLDIFKHRLDHQVRGLTGFFERRGQPDVIKTL